MLFCSKDFFASLLFSQVAIGAYTRQRNAKRDTFDVFDFVDPLIGMYDSLTRTF